MTWEAGDTEQQRRRAGCAVLAVGVFLLLCAWGLAVARGPQDTGDAAVRKEKIDLPQPERTIPAVGAGMLAYGIGLVIVLFVSLFALLRLSRNFREQLSRKPSKPTSTADVWSMHVPPKTPQETDASDEA